MAKTFKNPIAAPLTSFKPPDPFSKQPTYDGKKKLFPAGDYYGTGYKAKIGKMRGDSPGMNPVPQKSLRKAPESLA